MRVSKVTGPHLVGAVIGFILCQAVTRLRRAGECPFNLLTSPEEHGSYISTKGT